MLEGKAMARSSLSALFRITLVPSDKNLSNLYRLRVAGAAEEDGSRSYVVDDDAIHSLGPSYSGLRALPHSQSKPEMCTFYL